MKCINCTISIPELPENAAREEMLCNLCYEIEEQETNFRGWKPSPKQTEEAALNAAALEETGDWLD